MRRRRDEGTGRERRGSRGRGHAGRGANIVGIAGLVVLVGLIAAVAWAGAATGSSAAGRCESCHTKVDVVKGPFSHERHQDGRACASCHGDVRHERGTLLRAKAGLVDANASARPAVTAAGLRSPVGQKPSKLEGHKAVVCATCHDMATADCSQCHQPPAKDHYEMNCASCHSPKRPFSRAQLTHPTFGAHETATEACDGCHGKTDEKPSCRGCHGQRCGKGVTSMAGCLKCHKNGTADDWLEAKR